MRSILVALSMVLSFPAVMTAQVPTSGNVFFGYSYDYSKLAVDRASLNGWEASLEGKAFPHVGIVADFSGHYGTQDLPICPVVPVGGGSSSGCATTSTATHELDVMFGPRASFSVKRWTPFAQGLFGVAHLSSSNYGSDTSFAMALGGGFDYRIVKPVAWRFQLDYMRTRLTLAAYGFSNGLAQNNFRFSTGPVLRF
jgi:opacity protein-like surface antigen